MRAGAAVDGLYRLRLDRPAQTRPSPPAPAVTMPASNRSPPGPARGPLRAAQVRTDSRSVHRHRLRSSPESPVAAGRSVVDAVHRLVGCRRGAARFNSARDRDRGGAACGISATMPTSPDKGRLSSRSGRKPSGRASGTRYRAGARVHVTVAKAPPAKQSLDRSSAEHKVDETERWGAPAHCKVIDEHTPTADCAKRPRATPPHPPRCPSEHARSAIPASAAPRRTAENSGTPAPHTRPRSPRPLHDPAADLGSSFSGRPASRRPNTETLNVPRRNRYPVDMAKLPATNHAIPQHSHHDRSCTEQRRFTHPRRSPIRTPPAQAGHAS